MICYWFLSVAGATRWKEFLRLLGDAWGRIMSLLVICAPREGDAVSGLIGGSRQKYSMPSNENYFALDPFVNLPAGGGLYRG
jgi:hypothetical protein